MKEARMTKTIDIMPVITEEYEDRVEMLSSALLQTIWNIHIKGKPAGHVLPTDEIYDALICVIASFALEEHEPDCAINHFPQLVADNLQAEIRRHLAFGSVQ
jgi:hypothetical protein